MHLVISILGASEEFTWLDYLSRASVIVFFIVAAYGFIKPNPWWVTGREHRECLGREEEFKNMALKSIHAAEASASVGEHLVERDRQREGAG